MSVDRWHDLEQRWEDETVPLPQTEAEREAERERLEETEEAESRERPRALGGADGAAVAREHARARRPARGGRPARDPALDVPAGRGGLEDDARELAERLRERRRTPRVQVEPSGEMIAEVAPGNPFAIFGGLAG